MRHRTTILFANAEAMGQGFQYYTDPNQYCHAALSLSLSLSLSSPNFHTARDKSTASESLPQVQQRKHWM